MGNQAAEGATLVGAVVTDSVFTVSSINESAVGVRLVAGVTLNSVTATAPFAAGVDLNSNAFGSNDRSIIENSSITAQGAVQASGIDVSDNAVEVRHSKFSSTINTLTAISNGTIQVTQSLLSGGPVNVIGSSTVKCSAVTDENYNFFANTCP